jgi:hypothetical protein
MNTDAIEKIRKLLRMKHGGTPHEIATAMRLAQKLAAEAGIDLNTVDASLDHGRYNVGHSRAFAERGNVPLEIHAACQLVKQFVHVDFIVKPVLDRKRLLSFRPWRYTIVCIGSDSARDVATYLCTHLSREFGRAWRTRTNRRLRDKRSFLQGMAFAVSSELEKFAPPPPPPPDEMLQAWSQHLATINCQVESRPPRSQAKLNPKAALAGVDAAKDLHVRRPCAAAVAAQPNLIGATAS